MKTKTLADDFRRWQQHDELGPQCSCTGYHDPTTCASTKDLCHHPVGTNGEICGNTAGHRGPHYD